MSRAPSQTALLLAASLAVTPALAQTPAPGTAPTPTTVTLSAPGMTGPLGLNPNPFSIDLGPAGKTYISGVFSGLGLVQNNRASGDQTGHLDVSNGQLILQKVDGLAQYYVQVGAYALPSLGTPYVSATSGHAISEFYGAAPVAYFKLAPTGNFSIEAGKLPTLIGAEYTFTFQNMNIERGLLWNQEPAISRGVQANYTIGPVALALSANDGYYSDRFTWISGSAAWTINSANTLTFAAGGNTGATSYTSPATPLAQNNGSIYNLIFTHTAGPWTVTPYVQLSHIGKNPSIGINNSAGTWGGAVLANYAFSPNWSLAGRVEYIASSGSIADNTPNLLFGPGSKAVSLTLTPTFQYKRFFARAEFSFVKAFDTMSGYALGTNATATNQVRGLLETGILF